MSTKQTYTIEQVQQLLDIAASMLGVTAAPYKEPANLDNSIPQQSSPNTKLTYSVREAAERIGVSKPTMYELIRNNEIQAKRVGNKILIAQSALQDWLTKGE